MVLITHDIIGSDEDLAREVLVVAKAIAPCLSTLDKDTEHGKDASAILRRVYRTLAQRGSELVKSQRIGSAAVEYRDVESAFQGQPTRALRALCDAVQAAQATRGASRGSFPTERPLANLWPERY